MQIPCHTYKNSIESEEFMQLPGIFFELKYTQLYKNRAPLIFLQD